MTEFWQHLRKGPASLSLTAECEPWRREMPETTTPDSLGWHVGTVIEQSGDPAQRYRVKTT